MQKMLAAVTRTPGTGSERKTAEPLCRQLCPRSHTGMAPTAPAAPVAREEREGEEAQRCRGSEGALPPLPHRPRGLQVPAPQPQPMARRGERGGARRTLGVVVPGASSAPGTPSMPPARGGREAPSLKQARWLRLLTCHSEDSVLMFY